MSPVSLIPIFVLFFLACGVAYLLLRWTKIAVPKDRFASIDGLRGVLAFSVFLHHSVIWYYFLKTGDWTFPPSNVYSHLGPGSVAMFFMITSFLFYSKLLDAKVKGMDWIKLYVSRIYRIMPLYLFAVFVVFIVAILFSHFTFQVPPSLILSEFFKWLIFIEADINNIAGTRLIVAGVVWSLAYEWLFYCSLAWAGKTIFRIRTPAKILIVTGAAFTIFLLIILYFYPYGIVRRMCPFAGGIAAAFLVRNARIRKYCSSSWASCLLLALIGMISFYPDLSAPVPFACICLTFIIIAAGNDIFGLLTHRLLRYLGMISYSLYLLHGILLFCSFRFLIGFRKASVFSPLEHWLTIGCCTVLLIIACTVTYLNIEKPAQLKKTPALHKKIPAV